MRLLGTDRKQGRASGASTTISCRAGRGAEKHTGLLLQEGLLQQEGVVLQEGLLLQEGVVQRNTPSWCYKKGCSVEVVQRNTLDCWISEGRG